MNPYIIWSDKWKLEKNANIQIYNYPPMTVSCSENQVAAVT